MNSKQLGLNATVSLGRRAPVEDPYADNKPRRPFTIWDAAFEICRGMSPDEAEAFMQGFREAEEAHPIAHLFEQ